MNNLHPLRSGAKVFPIIIIAIGKLLAAIWTSIRNICGSPDLVRNNIAFYLGITI
jgi:hypothetical protein